MGGEANFRGDYRLWRCLCPTRAFLETSTANAYRRAGPPRQHGNTTMGTLSQADEAKLKAQLQEAVVDCTERCLYHSAKWCV